MTRMKEAHDPIGDWLNTLHKAFADCGRPASDHHMISVGGIDSPYAMRLWAALDRASVANHPGFDFRMGEHLDHLSSSGMRHFLPALLELALLRPDQIDDDGLSFLVARMEAMWVKGPTSRYYRGTTLTKRQIDALLTWCELMQHQIEGLDQHDIYDQNRIDCLRRVRELPAHLPSALHCVDFDADYLKELDAKEIAGHPQSRSHGWQRFKNKKGKRPDK